jgi:hypothetical protein
VVVDCVDGVVAAVAVVQGDIITRICVCIL